jgi:hypothetical protein
MGRRRCPFESTYAKAVFGSFARIRALSWDISVPILSEAARPGFHAPLAV